MQLASHKYPKGLQRGSKEPPELIDDRVDGVDVWLRRPLFHPRVNISATKIIGIWVNWSEDRLFLEYFLRILRCDKFTEATNGDLFF